MSITGEGPPKNLPLEELKTSPPRADFLKPEMDYASDEPFLDAADNALNQELLRRSVTHSGDVRSKMPSPHQVQDEEVASDEPHVIYFG